MAEPGTLTQPTSKKGVSSFVSVNAAPAPAPAVPPRPQGDLTRASVEEIAQAVRSTWPTKSADNRWNRSRGARDLLQHLSQFPGRDLAGAVGDQRVQPGRQPRLGPAIGSQREKPDRHRRCLLCLRIIRPSLEAFRSNTFLYYGQRFLAAQNDPLLEKFWAEVQATPVNPIHHGTALFDIAVALTTQGIALADLTPEAFLHYATRGSAAV
ncbi:hypothetical protein [Streptomyces sp. 3214.6]|uniref:hypothetical protein n=1 Tax=Streptomyces sp. 3214.6 TaxID=1882757 RepID=UPI00090B701F|nr:hypothetical protein [Streptomyces sp. 3214.6]SHH63097.1 hypothetical protein SAMN05444521_1200 [Streptomyces sp. 3214.6]